MRSLLRLAGIPLIMSLIAPSAVADNDVARLAELDGYWAEVSRSVREGDFEAYAAGCHPEAVIVSGTKKASYPLSKALARWKKDFDDTKAGTRDSNVTFRFSQRFGDETTAHETGIFCYSFRLGNGEFQNEYIHLEALLVKKESGWKILMEYQKAPATEAEWKALK